MSKDDLLERDERQTLELLWKRNRSQEEQKKVTEIISSADPIQKKITEIKKLDKKAHGLEISQRFNDFIKNCKDPRIHANLSHIQNEIFYCLPGFQKDFSATYILLVDDLTYITKTLSYMLEKAGFQVFSAKTGMEAIILFQKITPDVVITDIRLPDFNGFEIASFLRQIDMEIPIIFITAVDVDENTFRDIEGNTAFLQKPIKKDVLLNTIKELRQKEASFLIEK
jgi:CheY-like chemotaxis protein